MRAICPGEILFTAAFIAAVFISAGVMSVALIAVVLNGSVIVLAVLGLAPSSRALAWLSVEKILKILPFLSIIPSMEYLCMFFETASLSFLP